MMQIEVNTTTATLIPPRESLTPGSVNAVQLEFTFSDEWNGLTKTCVFSNELETVPAELQNDITSVPTEVLDEVYRWISVGVSGEDAEGTVIIPTIWCRIGQCIPGASGRFVTIDMLQAYWSKQEIDLHTEGDGSKFLGDDGVYHYVSQGGGDVTHEELDAALALKTDKDAFDALSATVDDKADKSEIITVTTGDGTKYLADDGTYKTITGGGDVTHEELDAAIAPLATKDEVSAAVEPLATKTELASATAGLATTAAMNAALALKADKTELASYAKQYDVNQALATKADKTETQTALAQKADKDEIITVTTGSGTLFLADDGTYKPAAGDPPDLSAYLTKTEAGTTYATKTELADKADASALVDYETTAHASATYATKTELADKADSAAVTALDTRVIATEGAITALQSDKADASALADYETTAHAEATYATKAELPDVSDMLTKTEAASTYATQTELADKADKSEIITVTTGTGTLFLADDGTYKPAAGDPPDLSAYLTKTEAGTTYETQTHAAETYATKAEVPDVSGFETTTHASATYATKTELTDGLATKADSADIADMLTKTEAGTTYATQTALTDGLATKADKTELSDYETSEHAAATYATKAEIPDVTGFETTAHAEATYATKTELADKADTATVDSALALKADKTELADYETSEHAAATYATKTEMTEGLAGKVDTADIADMLTKTEAESTYADKLSLLTLENAVDAQRDRINNLDANKADKTQIITVTSGTGTLFLADDGTYKPAAGDPPDLSAYLTKTEASTTYATISGVNATYATKEALTIASNELQEAIDLKADASALADYETTAHASATYATKTELADKADSATVAALSGVVTGHTASISALETGKADKSELPDVSDMLSKTEAGTTYATKTELDAKADASALADYETTAHAAATYETKADASQVKSITAAGFAVAPDSAGNVNVGGTDVSRATTSGSWGAETTYTISQTLPAGATSDTKGKSLTIFKRTENSGANPHIIMKIDGVQIATSADIPDVSRFATTDYVQNTFESTQHASATYLKISDASATYATKTELGDYETTAHASATYATKAELPDTSDMLTKTEADSTYETKADASPIKSLGVASNTTDWHTPITIDANGFGQLGGAWVLANEVPDQPGYTVHATVLQYLEPNVNPTYNSSGYGFNFVFRKKTSDTYYPEMEFNSFSRDGTTYRFTKTLPTKDYVDDVFATKDELTAATTTFTHTYTGDAQDNWTVTDIWSGSNGELQKITWKEYAATAGSPGELIYTGTDSATGQKRSVRIATYSELGDYTSGFATMQWVQEYIASLDGTNMSL